LFPLQQGNLHQLQAQAYCHNLHVQGYEAGMSGGLDNVAEIVEDMTAKAEHPAQYFRMPLNTGDAKGWVLL